MILQLNKLDKNAAITTYFLFLLFMIVTNI